MSLLDFTESESGKSGLSKGTVIEDLVIDLVEVSADVRLHHDVFGFTESVVESVVVDLIKGSTLALFRSRSMGLHKSY
jgi:hypothetical protein